MILITDRLSTACALKETIQVVEPCTVVALGQAYEVGSEHTIVICDIDPGTPDVLSLTKAVLARCRPCSTIPVLHLARRGGEAALGQARSLGATAVMPHDASPTQILFTVKRLVEARRSAVPRTAAPAIAVVADNVRKAGSIYNGVLGSLRSGEPVSVDTLERGSTAVLAAVGGGRLATWLDVVRSYDDITYQHCLLVACFAASFSMSLGLSVGGQRLVAKAALLHDIGKLHIDRDILNKPGKLTAAEMDVVRRHPAIGHRMLVNQGGFDPQVLDMVLHHHEFLDGSGYPDGIGGDAIAPLVRLLTICDIYAALVERRSYKAPMSSRDAFAILHGMAGKLDRSLLRSFEAMVEG
jgi:putative nucleotidyltransferase with HDIG domain